MASQIALDLIGIKSAWLWSTLATCSRLSVGCVITDHRGRIVSSGYNGAPAGEPHCDHTCDCGHEGLEDMFHFDCPSTKPCKVAVHSEANALKYAPEDVYFASSGYTMYSTHSPCDNCATEILDSGIRRLVYSVEYRNTSPLVRLAEGGIIVERREF